MGSEEKVYVVGENEKQNKQIFSSCVNNYDLIKDTGFRPEYSFEEGIKRTIEFFRKMLNFCGEKREKIWYLILYLELELQV